MSQDELKHYGILRQSGRYPWGSGPNSDTAFHRSMKFYDMIEVLKAKNLPEAEIAKAMGLSVADLRSTKTIAKEEQVKYQTDRAVTLKAKQVSDEAIAEELGISPATVRLRLKNSEKVQQSTLRATAEVVRQNVDKYEIVDIGKGTALNLDVADTKLASAIAVLRDEGYETHVLRTRNVGTKQFTNQQVIVKPGVTWAEASKMRDKIHIMGEYSEDNGKTFLGIHEPINISSKRLGVVYKEDGGTDRDGLIYIRPGVKDVSMGKNTYAQVRIGIDGTHFVKGIAVYKDDLPAGVDILFHSNKSKSVGKLGTLKEQSDDKDNPFGSVIKRQIVEIDPKTGKEKVTSALNLLREEGDWDLWRNSLPSQVLAKQPHSLIDSQLALTRDEVRVRMDEISKITNSVVKKQAYEEFADQIDSDAVDLRAAAMPRQLTQVIIPMPKMAKNEIYAPSFETGDKVVLIRFPHGGRFEIPEVTVNNNNRTAKKILGNARDAIGIHPVVAEKLSGADFDGDTVVVIPNRAGKIKGSSSLGVKGQKVYEDGLKNFEPKTKYGGFVQSGVDSKGRPVGNFQLMTQTGKEMGMITNLVTDMTVQGASPEHVVRAVRHSMVVIDAEKHRLDYKKSAQAENIAQLRELYQGMPGSRKKGASTLLSRATAKERVPERELRPAKLGGPIDTKTGAKVYVPTGRKVSVYDPKTKTYTSEKRLVESTPKRLDLTDDAFTLVRSKADPVERLYASHANEMKAMANEARLKAYNTPNPKRSPEAARVYKTEVDNLVAQLRAAEKKKPLERRADNIAGAIVRMKRQEDPLLKEDADRLAKVERQAKAAARARLNLEESKITFSEKEWDAVQAGAISPTALKKMLLYADKKQVADLSMPKKNAVMTNAIMARAKAMLNANASNADIAAALGISVTTLKAAISRGDL